MAKRVGYGIYFEKDIKVDVDGDDATPTVTKDRAFLGVVTMSERANDALGIAGLEPFVAKNETEIIEIKEHPTTVYRKGTDGKVVAGAGTVSRHWRAVAAKKDRARGKRVKIMLRKLTLSGKPDHYQSITLTFPREANVHHIAAWLGRYIPDAKKTGTGATDTFGSFVVEGSASRRIPTVAEAEAWGVDSNQGAESGKSAEELKRLADKARGKNARSNPNP